MLVNEWLPSRNKILLLVQHPPLVRPPRLIAAFRCLGKLLSPVEFGRLSRGQGLDMRMICELNLGRAQLPDLLWLRLEHFVVLFEWA